MPPGTRRWVCSGGQRQAGTVTMALAHMQALGMEDPTGGIEAGRKKTGTWYRL